MNIAVVTGANRGLGLELTKQLLAAGWRVLACCRDPKQFPAEVISEHLELIQLDLTDEKSILHAVAAVDHAAEQVQLLINNAGEWDGDSSDLDTPIESMDKATQVFQVNCVGTVIFTKRCRQFLIGDTQPVVVSISTGMSQHARADDYNAGHWAYSASKAALNLAIHNLAVADPKVKYLLVNPGWVQTRMGGTGATLPVQESARKIIELATQRASQFDSGAFVDYTGKPQPW